MSRKKNNYTSYDKDLFIIIFSCIILLAIILSCFYYFFPYESKYSAVNFQKKEQILSLKSKSVLSGSFILGIGSIYDEEYYFFFVKDTLRNGYVKHKIPSSSTILIEKDTTPSLIKNLAKQTIQRKYFFKDDATEVKFLNYNAFTYKIPDAIKYEYFLIVPKGVVTENVSWEAL